MGEEKKVAGAKGKGADVQRTIYTRKCKRPIKGDRSFDARGAEVPACVCRHQDPIAFEKRRERGIFYERELTTLKASVLLVLGALFGVGTTQKLDIYLRCCTITTFATLFPDFLGFC